jgi:hypothetical protein
VCAPSGFKAVSIVDFDYFGTSYQPSLALASGTAYAVRTAVAMACALRARRRQR